MGNHKPKINGKLTDEQHAEVERFLRSYEYRNRWFQLSSFITAMFTFLAIVFIISLIFQNQRDIKNTVEETKRQGQINQKYIRCIVLLPADAVRDPDSRAKAVDNCADQSKLPDKPNTNTVK